MKRVLALVLVLLGLALAETPVLIRIGPKGPDPAKLHVPTDAPYLLELVNTLKAPVTIVLKHEAKPSPAGQEIAKLLFSKGPLKLPPGGHLAVRYWPKAQGPVVLLVQVGDRTYPLRLILEPPDYYEGPSGCS